MKNMKMLRGVTIGFLTIGSMGISSFAADQQKAPKNVLTIERDPAQLVFETTAQQFAMFGKKDAATMSVAVQARELTAFLNQLADIFLSIPPSEIEPLALSIATHLMQIVTQLKLQLEQYLQDGATTEQEQAEVENSVDALQHVLTLAENKELGDEPVETYLHAPASFESETKQRKHQKHARLQYKLKYQSYQAAVQRLPVRKAFIAFLQEHKLYPQPSELEQYHLLIQAVEVALSIVRGTTAWQKCNDVTLLSIFDFLLQKTTYDNHLVLTLALELYIRLLQIRHLSKSVFLSYIEQLNLVLAHTCSTLCERNIFPPELIVIVPTGYKRIPVRNLESLLCPFVRYSVGLDISTFVLSPDEHLLLGQLLSIGLYTNNLLLQKFVATMYDDKDTLKKLLAPALGSALTQGDGEKIRLLADGFGDFVPENYLHTAIRSYEIQDPLLITLLVKHGANVDYQAEGGSTALMEAVDFGDKVWVQTLLQLGADLYIKDTNGRNALDRAYERGNQDIIALLESALHQPTEATYTETLNQHVGREAEQGLVERLQEWWLGKQ